MLTEPARLAEQVATAVSEGGRFAGLVATARDDRSTVLRAWIAARGHLETLETVLVPGAERYPALTPLVPPANWYEREIHDLFGIEPEGHPRLDPLVLPLRSGAARPRPGASSYPSHIDPDPTALPGHVSGDGVFTIPYGPVRSGVFESVEYLVETPGEEIPHVRTRVYHKHRGIDSRFGDLSIDDAVLLAERVEGTASVAHATAFCLALEALGDVEPPRCAQLVRVIHAEIERIAVHLDSIIRHTEAAGQAVAFSRMSLHKERILRLRADLCGHRFGRGVIVPGGVTRPPNIDVTAARTIADKIDHAIAEDTTELMTTPSFLDRLRDTGTLPDTAARQHGALGPVGRASNLNNDVRVERPYGAYQFLAFEPAIGLDQGDALARQRVRIEEIHQSFKIVRHALDEFDDRSSIWKCEIPVLEGTSLGSVEAPQGELVYLVEVERGRLIRVKPRSASFHNLALFPQAFTGDIFTDFAFIEASFGLSIAGVSG